jgi:hypothetical protein
MLTRRSRLAVWTMNPGEASGSVALKFKGIMQPSDVLRFHPEIQAQLDEIEKKGWKYLFIQTEGTAMTEVKAQAMPCRLRVSTSFNSKSPPPPPVLELNLGQQPLDLTGMPEVQEFQVNVSSKTFPRAATIELVSRTATYIHDALWKWDKTLAADATKTSQAKEVYEVARWVIEEKGYKLTEPYNVSHYDELAGEFVNSLK